MYEHKGKNQKKALFIFLITLFFNIFPQINQYPLQAK